MSRFIAETVTRVREAGATGEVTLRADSGFYSRRVEEACRKRGVRFSITIPLHTPLHDRIATLPEEAWAAIPYFLPGAVVEEIGYTPFGKKGIPVRLIVRRVPPSPESQRVASIRSDDVGAFVAGFTAVAVWEPLCGSTPMITTVSSFLG